MRKYLLVLILIPSISWSDIILDCKPTNPEDGTSRLIWALNLEKRDALQLKKAFMPNGQEVKINEGYPIEVSDISNETIYFFQIILNMEELSGG